MKYVEFKEIGEVPEGSRTFYMEKKKLSHASNATWIEKINALILVKPKHSEFSTSTLYYELKMMGENPIKSSISAHLTGVMKQKNKLFKISRKQGSEIIYSIN